MELSYYIPSIENTWTGRVDDVNNRDAFRIHQTVSILDLNDIRNIQLDLDKLNICLIGFKSDTGVKRNLGRAGAELGPAYIRKELANLPVNFDETTQIFDAGDIYCWNGNLEEAQEQLRKAIKIILDKKLFPIVIGGGHALSLGHYLGISDYLDNKQNIGIVNFDAHWDLRPYKNEGSSGTMFSQIADYCKSNQQMFNYLCLGVQISGNTQNLFNRAEQLGAKHILAKDFTTDNKDSNRLVIQNFVDSNDKIYLTLCSDVFSSAYAPGVSAMQPFGMNPEIVLNYIKQIFKSNKVVGFDIAEVAPRFDHDNQTAKLAAIIIYAIINQLSEM
ncbi:MAG: formimidoylglutamase [Bacteroidales bacterium]|nr:formimidoylglutamase [Bacteroidales bacterium]